MYQEISTFFPPQAWELVQLEEVKILSKGDIFE
jgi:hypothetical protein